MNVTRNSPRARSVVLEEALPVVPWTGPVAFFLDVDGTLLPLVADPEQVAVPHLLLETLKRLRGRSGGALALVSGRPISSLDRLFAPERFALVGQHGTERRDAAGILTVNEAHAGALAVIRPLVRELARMIPGALVEDKGLSIAIHVGGETRALAELQRRLADPLLAHPELGLLQGKSVLEVRSAQVDKGQALSAFMAEPPFHGRLPVFFGDDVTDESAFTAVNRLGGVSVKVGTGPSVARHRVATPAQAVAWLAQAVQTEERI